MLAVIVQKPNKMSNTNCPNCRAAIKKGLIADNNVFDKLKSNLINEYSPDVKEGYCDKCGPKLFSNVIKSLDEEKKSIGDYLQKNLSSVPVVTVYSPMNWNYSTLG